MVVSEHCTAFLGKTHCAIDIFLAFLLRKAKMVQKHMS